MQVQPRTELLPGIYITTDNLENYYIRKVGDKLTEAFRIMNMHFALIVLYCTEILLEEQNIKVWCTPYFSLKLDIRLHLWGTKMDGNFIKIEFEGSNFFMRECI